MSSASPPHTDQVSQEDSVSIKDVLDSTPQNVNPLTKEGSKKLLKDSTNATLSCNNPILVRVDKIEKEKLEFEGEKPQET